LTKGIITEQQLTLLVIIIISLVLIVLVIVIYIVFLETDHVHKDIMDIQKEITLKIDKATEQFGLVVEFIREEFVDEKKEKIEGVTYDVSRKLIENAETSIVYL